MTRSRFAPLSMFAAVLVVAAASSAQGWKACGCALAVSGLATDPLGEVGAAICSHPASDSQSSLQEPPTAGNTSVTQSAGSNSTSPADDCFMTGLPTVQRTVVNAANGHTYHQLESSNWTVAETTADSMGGHLVTIDDQAEQDWCVANFQNYLGLDIILWIGLNDADVEGTFVWSSGAPVVFTNWDTAQPDDAGGDEDYVHLRKNSAFGFWSDLSSEAAGFHVPPHGLVEVEPPRPGIPFCAGDGLDPNVTSPCPCGNFGTSGHGCANSFHSRGALLVSAGAAVPDTLVLAASEMPATVSVIYMQGDALDDAVFGDGVRCAGGTMIRLRTKQNASGASQFPDAGDPSVSTRGLVTPGSGVVRYYQAYYRNASLAFCPPSTFNATNGLSITW